VALESLAITATVYENFWTVSGLGDADPFRNHHRHSGGARIQAEGRQPLGGVNFEVQRFSAIR